jgi:hypothetical protein
MQPVRQADRVATQLTVLVRDEVQATHLIGLELSTSGIVLGGMSRIEDFAGHVPREVSFVLPNGHRVDAWAQPVRPVGQSVAFRLLTLTETERDSILATVRHGDHSGGPPN